jgi:hypothetical protein
MLAQLLLICFVTSVTTLGPSPHLITLPILIAAVSETINLDVCWLLFLCYAWYDT